MNAPPFPLNPSTGERFGQWVWNGAQWVCAPANGVQVLTTAFTASGAYMPSSGLVSVQVECWGGGGAGGAANTTNATIAVSGGGGGSGGYSKITLPAALVAGGVQVTIGAGGTASTQAASTTFGALCVANGGGAGTDDNGSTDFGDAGDGAPAGTGDIAFPGASGFCGVTAGDVNSSTQGGLGGTMAGGNGVDLVGTGGYRIGRNGAPGTGAGGTGGVINHASVPGGSLPVVGGLGGSGLCVVTEYCWAFTGDNDCLNPPVNVNARVAVTHVPWTGPGPCPPGWGEYEGE